MNYQWLDAAYPKSAAQFLGALKAGNQYGFTFYIGGDICLNAWPKPLVDEVRAQYPGMAIHVPDLDAGDGPEAVALARSYGLPAGYFIALDIEPGVFRSKANPAIAGAFADAWCDAVRAAGYVPVVYGTAATIAACANHAAFVWLTVPGQPNPDGAGLAPAFFAGRRAIQYQSVALNGVECDVTNSQYPLRAGLAGAASGTVTSPASVGGDPMNLGQKRAAVREAYLAAFDREPESQAAEDAWANKIADDGSNLDVIVAQIADSAEGVAHRAKLAAALAEGPEQPGPAGPAGPVGPAGKDGISPDPAVIQTGVLRRIVDAIAHALGLQ